MSFHPQDTICAIATATGGAARGMVRISGPATVAIADRVFEPADGNALEEARCATAMPGRLHVQLNSSPRFLPSDLFLWPTNRSYTRETLAELHTVGSRPVLEAVLDSVCRAGARLAEPGEFTLRAFLAGRLDLTQAEAVLGVIDAHRSEELDTALAQLAGGLARPLYRLREELLQLLAELEAGLDFVEEDIEFVSSAELLDRFHAASELLGHVATQMASRHIASDEMQIALIGPPNVGKSSMFNALVKQFGNTNSYDAKQNAAALVSPRRGTTRDYLVAPISLGGMRCELVDTAGVDFHTVNDFGCTQPLPYVDAAAQAAAVEQRKRATIRAYCIEVTGTAANAKSQEIPESIDTDCELVVITKTDLSPQSPDYFRAKCGVPIVATSSRTGHGLDHLCGVLGDILTRSATPPRGQVVAKTADRCRESIRLAASSLQSAIDVVRGSGGHELIAVELRTALDELGKVVGAVYTDDLLDRIFGTFCIGK